MTVGAGDVIAASDINSILNRPRFVCTFGTPSITNNSVNTLTPTAATYNVGSMWSSGTDITIPTGEDGDYWVGIVLRYASQTTAAGFRQARFSIGGTEYMQWNIPAPSNLNSTNIEVFGAIRVPLAAGNVITFGAFQNSGGALALVGNSRGWVEKVIQ